MSAISFLLPHIKHLSNCHKISLIVNTNDTQFLKEYEFLTVHNVKIIRKISPIWDFIGLLSICKIFFREKFDIIHAITPKAGLLAMLGGYIVRIPIRVHWITGQVWATKEGFFKQLLINVDKLTYKLSTHLLVDSYSQREFLKENTKFDMQKATVLGSGSVCGVDVNRFKRNKQKRLEIRDSLGFHSETIVILFIGRLTTDKGVFDLLSAFKKLATKNSQIALLFVGPDEGAKETLMLNSYPQHDRIKFIDYTENPENYMNCADIFCLPSYREGFGSVVIEAAASLLPSVVSNIYGLRDSIVDGETGFSFTVGNVNHLEDRLNMIICNKILRLNMAKKARIRAELLFNQKILTAELDSFYKNSVVNKN